MSNLTRHISSNSPLPRILRRQFSSSTSQTPCQMLRATQSVRPSIQSHRPWQYAQSWRQKAQKRTYRQAFNYQRYQQSRSLLQRWAQSPYFYYQVGGIALVAGTYYTMNLEEVPISHRRRFRNISYETEQAMSQQGYQQVMQEYQGQFLSPRDPSYQMVQRVARRLIPHSGMTDQKWEVNVIRSDQKNAFVIPGGKIFVFTGLLELANTEDRLATVLSHEISHNVAHHAAERMSSASILLGIAWISSLLTGVDAGITNGIFNFVFSLPNSRAQESEADYIGLLMLSEACYDPQEALVLWRRMHEAEKVEVPQFISTHPSNTNRIAKMQEWLPQAEDKRAQSECQMIRPHVNDFWAQSALAR